MSKKIGLWSMILLCLNGIVGSGIFLLPGQVAAVVGNGALEIYGIVAAIVLAIAWCFSKCAEHFNRNGGAYLYAKEAFGDFIGFEIGIMRWVVGLIAWASLTVGFVMALGTLWPIVLVAPFKQFLIVGLIALLGFINALGLGTIKKLNNVITVAKLLPLLAFMGVGIFALFGSHHALVGDSMTMGAMGSAALMIFYAFSGFDALPVAASSMKDAKKNIPRAMMWSVVLASFIYFIVQLICVATLGPGLSGSATPISDCAQVFFGPVGQFLVSLSMLVAIMGVKSVCAFISPRSCSAMAEEGVFPAKLMEKNRFGSPWIAVVLSVVLTSVIALSGSFVQLVTISVLSRFVQYIATCLALYVLERKGVMQPFSHPWKRVIPLFALVGIGWLTVHAAPFQLLLGFGALLIGVPLYFIQKKIFASTAPEKPTS